MKAKRWFEQAQTLKYVREAFLFYAFRHYDIRFTTIVPTACVSLTERRLLINPTFVEEVAQKLGDEGLRFLVLEAIIAHEAGHVRFSGPKPAGTLGQLWNALEDERIESLMRQRYPHLKRHFSVLAQAMLQDASLQDAPLNLCLTHRWAVNEDRQVLSTDTLGWERVFPLVEASWLIEDSDQVTGFAEEILKILDPQSPASEQMQQLSSASGEDPGEVPQDPMPMPDSPPSPPALDEPSSNPSGSRVLQQAARQLHRLLLPPSASRVRESHRTRGRFDYGSFIGGTERMFRMLPGGQEPERWPITLLLDTSWSMDGMPLHHAVTVARTLNLACHEANLPFTVVTFDSEARKVREPHLQLWDADQKLQDVQCAGMTYLAPALSLAVHGPKSLIFIVCDGGLGEGDLQECLSLVQRNRHHQYIPLLIAEAASHQGDFRRVFSRAILADTAEKLLSLLGTWLASWQSKHQ